MFRTQKALALCGISPDSYRHWKDVLTPLRGRDGRGTSLSLSEVVTLAVVHRAVTLGIPVSRLAEGSIELFERVSDHVRTGGTPYYMFLAGDAVAFGTLTELPDGDAIALVRIDKILASVRQELANDPETGRQLDLF